MYRHEHPSMLQMEPPFRYGAPESPAAAGINPITSGLIGASLGFLGGGLLAGGPGFGPGYGYGPVYGTGYGPGFVGPGAGAYGPGYGNFVPGPYYPGYGGLPFGPGAGFTSYRY